MHNVFGNLNAKLRHGHHLIYYLINLIMFLLEAVRDFTLINV